MKVRIVVADAFERFAEKPDLLRFSELLKKLREGSAADLQGHLFVAGQGLDEMQLDHAYCLALSKGLDAEFADWRLWRAAPLADQTHCRHVRSEYVSTRCRSSTESTTFQSMRNFMKSLLSVAIPVALLIVAPMSVATAAGSNSHKEKTMQNVETKQITVPATHAEEMRISVAVDGTPAVLTRYVRRDGRNAGLGGEHFSTLVDAQGVLKGFTNMSIDLLQRKALPSRQRAEQVAREFLQETAPDLLQRMEILWIEPHDEFLHVLEAGRDRDLKLTSMKVKARNLADGRWFWVIVGPDERPMVFERDIQWVTFPGHRKTEKWLHDDWLKKNLSDVKAKTA